jgi:restriction system protein
VAIPDFQSIFLPTLKALSDREEHTAKELRLTVASNMGVTEHEQAQLLPSGNGKIFGNRVAWSIAYLKMAELISSPKRGIYRITDSGSAILKQNLERLSVQWLTQNTVFGTRKAGWTASTAMVPESLSEYSAEMSPDDQINDGFLRIRADLKSELMDRVKRATPQFFEQLVVDLLLQMGYGTSTIDGGFVTGKTGDGGIDGIIHEDKLGLERIYIQAKHWENAVGSQELQKFAGALQAMKARKGVFITTSAFSKPAYEFVDQIDTRIVLIDGNQLTDLMIDHNVGVSLKTRIEMKKIDLDYFADE